jgi:FecR protein
MNPKNLFAARSIGIRSRLALAFTTFLLSVAGATAADLSQAVVRQKFNVVTLAPTLTAQPKAVAQGAVVRDENVVRTGTESRAELEFTDQTLARLGANSLFSFDAQAHSLSCERGALLFSKPAHSGRVELRSGAVTAAITGSTGFISTSPNVLYKKGKRALVNPEDTTTILGMLEGKLKGDAGWRDASGRQRTAHFSLGPGEMLVSQAGRPPAVVQFDLPRFVKSSPLIHGFKGALLNQGDLQKAVAEYQSDERRGFIEATNVPSGQPQSNVAWLAYNSPNNNSFDASVAQLGSSTTSGNGGFVNVGGNGIIRGQLTWMTNADLDLHLILPDQQHVFYANPSVTFNNGQATAILDHDNQGEIIDVPPSLRVENIAINGVPSAGTYTFYANSFNTSNGSDAFTLRVIGNGRTQTITGTLSNGQNSTPVIVQIPPGG